jgi:RimJ/RimL family protein N-acetyltransferase
MENDRCFGRGEGRIPILDMEKDPAMMVLETARLRLGWLTVEDAAFMLRLLNEPSYIQHIGDRGVRSLTEAQEFLQKGPIASYEKHGFGLYRVERKEDGARIGVCGLLRRDLWDEVDIGYAFVPEAWGKGYALESTAAVMEHGRRALGIERIIAVVAPDNPRSIRVLTKLGLRFERKVRMKPDEDEIDLYS